MMTIEINDKIFGSLTQWADGSWDFDFFSGEFETKMSIHIETDDFGKSEKPSEKQYATFEWFKNIQGSLKSIIAPHIIGHYIEYLDETRAAWGKEADENAPLLQKPDDIWNLLSSPKVWLLADYADISIEFRAKWDPEHGVTVLIRDREVIRVE